ncbi:bifunctional peptidase and (3S)-lysyl hydroxylase Jmjd7 isoform X1 [Anopheles bellator]|uniref:bifunctional peptidase and (3S)-lysyl hydroxylase Jmjd7 isoform X1 n=1 Tax=Anopheles bellator TaxID=139047 RepID=UPI0026499E11|nr:bifunctional peptidase and (3S)-lysyl hydroxylase Jmjd7 isoform X1 [Anopheles bellator]XP_058057934.1 bifunctional peptidase and (3S)-lysyl hydroxylase Jmjd7 isoform X1 [Anopheles bellator]
MNSSILRDAFQVLTSEAKDLFLPASIPETFGIPTSLEFVRDYVAKNIPLVMRESITDWPALEKWNSKFFRETIPDKEVTVAVTPNGYADGLALHDSEEHFVLPMEQTMRMADFLSALDRKDSDSILYIQRQNSNLTEDFGDLWNDVCETSLEFASDAFNKSPDAVNFWMGDERAITSMHKDPYENIYCVISGYKDFILIPPIDLHNVPRKRYPMGIYMQEGDNNLVVEQILDEIGKPRLIEWVSVDPLAPDLERFPSFANATTYEIRLNAGDILYLPSLWYHHVRQSHKCIAINFWYDMEYDARYCFYKMVEKLCNYGQ